MGQIQAYSFLRTNAKQQMAEVEFLQFTGKINIMINLSIMPLDDYKQTSQVDMFTKSEILDSVAVFIVCYKLLVSCQSKIP